MLIIARSNQTGLVGGLNTETLESLCYYEGKLKPWHPAVNLERRIPGYMHTRTLKEDWERLW